ncbi:hypothetical protein O181_047950 [Austropuccinia psidii MF-1]|uniref:Uncharacterized protein n=1 Tax=Austropuccinia psidii MF-1 TaxID=1389203 RepID=A0A9Q3DWA5_9BASI|nr:hypothetical protein [Austropuccinia psidii MF-1]
MMKQTPISFIKHFGNVPNFPNQHIKLTHNYIHCKLTGPKDNPMAEMIRRELWSKPISNPSPLNLILNKEELMRSHCTNCETILPLSNPPWAQPITQITNTSLTKEQARETIRDQISNELTRNTLVLFSDGSLLHQKGSDTQSHHLAWPPHSSSPLLRQSSSSVRRSTLEEKISHPETNTETLQRPKALDNPFSSIPLLVPGHVDIPKNEKANSPAKLAEESQEISTCTINTISISLLRQLTLTALTTK